MTAAMPWARVAGAVLALALAVTGPGVAAAGTAQADDASLELAAQTPSVGAGGAFVLDLRAEGAGAGTRFRTTVHDRVRSRSELARTFDAEGLRGAVHTQTVPAAAAADGAGGVRLVIDLAEGTDAGLAVSTPGVYPVSVDLLDAGGERMARLVTHLVLRPPASPEAPPLDVAVVLRVGAAPAPPGEPPLDPEALDAFRALVEAAVAVSDVPVTLAPVPDTLAQLVASGGTDEALLVDSLRALAASSPLLALPYVATSPDALAEAGLEGELARQLDRGVAVQREVLGMAPSQAAWLAGADLGGAGLELLGGLGVRRVVVAPDHVELVPEGVLTPAGPFEVVPPPDRRDRTDARDPDTAGSALDALATDAQLNEILGEGRAEPELRASRVLADLSMLWFERPGTARAAVLPVDAEVDDGRALQGILEGLRATTLFRPVALDDAYRDAEPLTDRRGDVLRRTVLPDDPAELGDEVVAGLTELRELRGSVEAMVGPDAAVLSALDRHALRAMAAGIDRRARERELDAGRAAVDGLAGAVHTPEEATITLTAREGRVPLTIENGTGGPVDVRVRLSSPKLDLPGGDTIAMTLTEARTRLDIAVRTRASGSFPFEVEVTSPDGRIRLATTTYSVRSTAVSGVGVVLSAGAGLFLIVWWARHWREARRSRKLVDGGTHPAARG